MTTLPPPLLPAAAAAAAAPPEDGPHARPDLTLHDNDVVVAVRYRLEVKRTLGRSVQRVLDRKAGKHMGWDMT